MMTEEYEGPYAWALDWEAPISYAREVDGSVRATAPDGRTVLVRIDPDGELYLNGVREDVGDDYPAWLGLLDEAAESLEAAEKAGLEPCGPFVPYGEFEQQN